MLSRCLPLHFATRQLRGSSRAPTLLKFLSLQHCACFSESAIRSRRERQWSTPLAEKLGNTISATGPVPLATYMRMCMTSDLGGYYSGAVEKEGRDQFGQKGDFITSPEISQVFGELIGIWFVTEWMAQGRPRDGVELIELGPGRGTLMFDVLRTMKRYMGNSITHVYLVETSPGLREAQNKLLCAGGSIKESEHGYVGTCRCVDGAIPVTWTESIQAIPTSPGKMPFIIAHEFFDALPIHAFQAVPVTAPLPASALSPAQATTQPGNSSSESSPPTPSPPPTTTAHSEKDPTLPARPPPTAKITYQWRELVVTPTPPPSRFDPPPATASLDPPPDFQLVLSKNPTRHSTYLPQTSPRYRALLPSYPSRASSLQSLSSTSSSSVSSSSSASSSTHDVAMTSGSNSNTSDHNPTIEISPEATLFASFIAQRIGGASSSSSRSSSPSSLQSLSSSSPHKPAGAALIVDYGPLAPEHVPSNSLRGIRQHRVVENPFVLPGLVDLSADVDFEALAEAALRASRQVEVHGPVEQGAWLRMLGGEERVRMMTEELGREGSADGDAAKDKSHGKMEGEVQGKDRLDEQEQQRRKTNLWAAWQRLVGVGPDEMGKVYKFLAVVPEARGKRLPVGFGGSVVGS